MTFLHLHPLKTFAQNTQARTERTQRKSDQSTASWLRLNRDTRAALRHPRAFYL